MLDISIRKAGTTAEFPINMSNQMRTLSPFTEAIEVPYPSPSTSKKWGSDVIAESLHAIGLKYIALNPGASFRGLHDSLVNHIGNREPQMLLCLHEEHAVSIAHGYGKVAGEPMAVILHSNVGLMHGAMGIFNAWCDRVPMIVLGATGPVDAAKRRPWIDWIHTSADQGALVRDFTKWDDQPASVTAAGESIMRGAQITRTSPKAPVYINLDASIQEELISTAGTDIPDAARYAAPPNGRPDETLLTAIASALNASSRTVLLFGRVSRSTSDWDNRIKLAETLNAKVITDLKQAASFPTSHRLHCGAPGFFLSAEACACLREADVIVSFDGVDLGGTLQQAYQSEKVKARVVHASLDQHLHRGWGKEYFGLPPVDYYAMCDPDAMVKDLIGRVTARAAAVARTAANVSRSPAAETLSIQSIAQSLGHLGGDGEITLVRLPLGWNGAYRHFEHPMDYLGYDGGGGIGSGPGMCIGAALALNGTGRIAVGILGDGDFLMGVTALWTAVHYGIPMLIVVANNGSFYNDEMHQERVAMARGRPVENKWIGQRISGPDVDLAAIARAQGAVGIGPISTVEKLHAAMQQGLEAVRAGRVCVIDARVVPGYDANLSGQVQRR